MATQVVDHFDRLLDGIRKGLVVAQAETQAGLKAGSVNYWRSNLSDLGPTLAKDMACSEACLEVRARLAGLNGTTQVLEPEPVNIPTPLCSPRSPRSRPPRKAPTGDHPHHWDIPRAAPDTPVEGTCRVCGSIKSFQNAIEDAAPGASWKIPKDWGKSSAGASMESEIMEGESGWSLLD